MLEMLVGKNLIFFCITINQRFVKYCNQIRAFLNIKKTLPIFFRENADTDEGHCPKGHYLRFYMTKENKETHYALNIIAKLTGFLKQF